MNGIHRVVIQVLSAFSIVSLLLYVDAKISLSSVYALSRQLCAVEVGLNFMEKFGYPDCEGNQSKSRLHISVRLLCTP